MAADHLGQALVESGLVRQGGAGRFDAASIRKARFYLDQETSCEIDLHAACENDDGTDLMVEVKDWESEPSMDAVRRFVAVKNALSDRLERSTVFLFYSESGLGEDATAALAEAGIPILDPAMLAGYEAA